MDNTEIKAKMVENIKDQLDLSMDPNIDDEAQDRYHDRAVELLDKLNDVEKVESSEREGKKNRFIKCIEIIAVPVLTVAFGYLKDSLLMDRVNAWETDGNMPSTSANRSIVNRFFKK